MRKQFSPCKHPEHMVSDFCPGISKLEKARERVVRAAKAWRKVPGGFDVAESEDICTAVDALNRLEEKRSR